MTDLYLQRQRYTITGSHGIELEFEIDEDQITIFNERGNTDFKFKNANTKEVLDYWEELFKCMLWVVEVARKDLDKPRGSKLSSTNPKGPAQAKTQGVRGRKAKAK